MVTFRVSLGNEEEEKARKFNEEETGTIQFICAAAFAFEPRGGPIQYRVMVWWWCRWIELPFNVCRWGTVTTEMDTSTRQVHGFNKIVKDNRVKMWAKVGFELHNSYNNDRHHNMNGGSLWAANCWLIRVPWYYYYYACHCGSMYYVGLNFWRRSAGIISDLKEMLRRIWLGLSFNSQVTRWHKLLPLLSNCHPHRWPLLIPVGLKMVRSWLWHIFEKCVHTRVIMWRL